MGPTGGAGPRGPPPEAKGPVSWARVPRAPGPRGPGEPRVPQGPAPTLAPMYAMVYLDRLIETTPLDYEGNPDMTACRMKEWFHDEFVLARDTGTFHAGLHMFLRWL